MLKQRGGTQLDVGTAVFDNGETCLHLAVSGARREMVRYLLDEYPAMANQATTSLNETPIFYVLSKLKDQPASLKLALAEHFQGKADFGHRNKNQQTCTQAYADQHGVDETALFIENAAKKEQVLKQMGGLESISTMMLQPFPKGLIERVNDKKVQEGEKARACEEFMFQFA